MSRKFLTHLDLNTNELQNANLQNLATAPGSPAAGRVYYDTALGTSRVWNGSAWIALDASKLSALIPMSALTVDPTNRANHTGTQTAATISNLATVVQAYTLNQFAAPTANVAMGSNKLTGLGTPSAAGDSAEYSWVIGQVQSAAAGISSKQPVAAVAVANITLSGAQTIDGVSITAGQRVLVTGQTTTTANGVYVASASAWARSTAEGGAQGEMDLGATWLVDGGTTYAGALFRLSNATAPTIGTTAISIVQFSAGSSYTAGTNGGIAITGGAISVLLPGSSGLLTAASGLKVDTSLVVEKLATTITGDGSTTSFAVTHALAGGLDVQVQVYEISTGSGIEADITRTSTTNVNIGFAVAPLAAKTYRVLLQG